MTTCCFFHGVGGHTKEQHLTYHEALALYQGDHARLGERLLYVHSWFPSTTHGRPERRYDPSATDRNGLPGAYVD
jgi:hypothetical protein